MKNDKLILGLLAGLAIGALAGVLLAPHKGERTRKRILRAASHAAGNLKSKAEDVIESAENKYADAVHTAGQNIKKVISGLPNINN